jgi:hypothetical protein
MRINYIDILTNKVEIPIIQRDYAQGRTDIKTSKIRKDFLDVLFEFIQQKAKDPKAEKELDFIYGFNEGDEKQPAEFVPIDGQQRLTTLWLLYWFVAAKENIADKDKIFLANFVYETRHSTTQFFKELIKFSPNFTNTSISSEIKNQSWYFETWDYDPSIQAMLVVLDDIEYRFTEIGLTNVWDEIGHNSCPFYFYKLDMKKVGLTDDLYIKMNSRGKPLTEFEYFKAGFAEKISDTKQRKRFEQSIDGIWVDTIWQIVNESGTINSEDDIALTVDNAFLNLFNFITSVISFRKEIHTSEGNRYINTIDSAELLPIIYSDRDNQDFLFDILDAICNKNKINVNFWKDTFYYGKASFNNHKTRLFFQHGEPNLLKRCLFYFAENRGLTFPEQLLLLGCLTEFKNPQKEFVDRIRTIRNLVANSENELRESILGKSFDEVENYILNGDLNVLNNFKTDQIDEEKQKKTFLNSSINEKQIIQQLEDSDIFRGSISLLPFDDKFGIRASMFLKLFDEDDFINKFHQKSNLLLCFGDYTQDDGSLTNMMASNKSIVRGFLTTPGYNKNHFTSKTRVVLTNCLDYFIANPKITEENKIHTTMSDYKTNAKDWRYYFMKYYTFRNQCQYGYFQWKEDDQYSIWKMGKKQFNGYHWDPFLHEIAINQGTIEIELSSYGTDKDLIIHLGKSKIYVSSLQNGFLFKSLNKNSEINPIIQKLIDENVLNDNGELTINQNDNGEDLEDRIEKLEKTIFSFNDLNPTNKIINKQLNIIADTLGWVSYGNHMDWRNIYDEKNDLEIYFTIKTNGLLNGGNKYQIILELFESARNDEIKILDILKEDTQFSKMKKNGEKDDTYMHLGTLDYKIKPVEISQFSSFVIDNIKNDFKDVTLLLMKEYYKDEFNSFEWKNNEFWSQS